MKKNETNLIVIGAIITGLMLATASFGSFALGKLYVKNMFLHQDIEVLKTNLSTEQNKSQALQKNIEILKTDIEEKDNEIKGLTEIENDLSEQLVILVDDINLREKEIKRFKKKVKENENNEKYLKGLIAQKEKALERANSKYKKKEIEYQKILGAKEQVEGTLVLTEEDNINLQWKQLRLSVQMEACSKVLKNQRVKCLKAFDTALRDSEKRQRFESCSRQNDVPFWGKVKSEKELYSSKNWQRIGDDQYTSAYYIDFCDESLKDNRL